MIIGYELNGIDNHSYFFDDAPNNIFCNICGNCIDRKYYPKNFKIKNKSDFSFSYDGGLPIISSKFKEFLEKELLDIDFLDLNEDKSLFLLSPRNHLPYKAQQKDNFCNKCQQYFDVIAPIHLFQNHIEDGFFRSDLDFGSGKAKSPIIIIGTNTAKILNKAKKEYKFRGLEILPIEN
ncbi:hypothetical protein [Rodentibacter caecimuris]|uniref:hypothetical protein n=1 Tax=Rodentibacter caecimuris TaxID=1796644 RepID=UPI00211A8509|nr:hypothetical protein [Rodentibacter heylii]MCQ9122611.1 hypothetical protein [Rodentibacter heylii]